MAVAKFFFWFGLLAIGVLTYLAVLVMEAQTKREKRFGPEGKWKSWRKWP